MMVTRHISHSDNFKGEVLHANELQLISLFTQFVSRFTKSEANWAQTAAETIHTKKFKRAKKFPQKAFCTLCM
jgi:hypothetical protein